MFLLLQIEELKSQLHITSHPPFNLKEAERLKTVIGKVYGERSRLRRNMADLDAAERDTLLRVLRKVSELSILIKPLKRIKTVGIALMNRVLSSVCTCKHCVIPCCCCHDGQQCLWRINIMVLVIICSRKESYSALNCSQETTG